MYACVCVCVCVCVFLWCPAGAGTALLGKKAAMACHAAVETAISDHYNDQIREIHAKDLGDDQELRQVLLFFFRALIFPSFFLTQERAAE